MTPGNPLASTVRTWWSQRDAREKTLIATAAVLIAVAGVWLAAVAPAFHTLRQFETTRATQEAQLHTMRALQAQAQTLQAQPHVSASAASQALKAATEKTFGTQADITLSNGSAVVNLRHVSPDALAQWLANVRSNAHATPLQMRITRNTTNSTAGTATGWSGSVQLALPAN
jgi:general secretion pathway protein M